MDSWQIRSKYSGKKS